MHDLPPSSLKKAKHRERKAKKKKKQKWKKTQRVRDGCFEAALSRRDEFQHLVNQRLSSVLGEVKEYFLYFRY